MGSKAYIAATLSGVAQMVFCEGALPGLFVLAAVAALAPWTALAALGGAALATLVAASAKDGREDWRLGLAGFNAAIVGMFWGGPLARLGATASLYPIALLGCIAVEALLRPHFRRFGMPMLGTPALLIGWVSDWTFRAFGDSLWPQPGTLPLGDWSLPLAIASIALAISMRSVAAAVTVGAAASIACSWSAWWFGIDGMGPVTLWAYAVAPAALGGFLIVPLVPLYAIGAALLAGSLAAAVWFIWIYTPLVATLPPLLAPCLIGVWGALAIVVHRGGALILDPGLWRLAALIATARRDNKPVVVLSGAGISTASGIPDYISGAWLDPAMPVQTYAFGAFLASEASRRAYWTACARFRDVARNAQPNAAHVALAALEREGYLSAIVTQNVDGLHQAAGATGVIEIHGAIDKCHCLSCAAPAEWPVVVPWRSTDFRCVQCGGFLKPAVVAMGEEIPLSSIREAEAAVAACGVLLVVGTQVAISSAASLLALARRSDAKIAMINIGAIAQPVGFDDILLKCRVEDALAALTFLLGVTISTFRPDRPLLLPGDRQVPSSYPTV
jgi:NAD-dependent SIR2 family protein deacetylase